MKFLFVFTVALLFTIAYADDGGVMPDFKDMMPDFKKFFGGSSEEPSQPDQFQPPPPPQPNQPPAPPQPNQPPAPPQPE